MKKKRLAKVRKAIAAYRKKPKEVPSDVFGSYTGNSKDLEKPIQDADDI